MSESFLFSRLQAVSWQAVELPTPLPVEALPTPALVLDRMAMERNLVAMSKHLAAHGKSARPHAKTHKCALIAQAQLAHGAVGLCAAKVGEAAALVLADVPKVLVTSPVQSPGKVEVLAELSRRATEVLLVVDSMAGLELLQKHLPEDARVGLVLDVDIEMGRTGIRQLDEAKRIIAAARDDNRIGFAGVQHYAGHLQHITSFAERKARSTESWQKALTFARTAADELPPIISGGGSGTYAIDTAVPEITDLQVGSYLFMDREYRDIESGNQAAFNEFEVSLTVACTAISAPLAELGAVTVNGGFKAFASDSGVPVPYDGTPGRFRFAGDEHGVFRVTEGHSRPRLGDVLRFVVPHCDPTVNLHEVYWVLEADGLVHSLWPITARGLVW
jgi:D-serine deaminase-like pyridoxal phosphate-dependent protein